MNLPDFRWMQHLWWGLMLLPCTLVLEQMSQFMVSVSLRLGDQWSGWPHVSESWTCVYSVNEWMDGWMNGRNPQKTELCFNITAISLTRQEIKGSRQGWPGQTLHIHTPGKFSLENYTLLKDFSKTISSKILPILRVIKIFLSYANKISWQIHWTYEHFLNLPLYSPGRTVSSVWHGPL